MARKLAVIGSPSGAGACGVGQEQAPAALRGAGLIESLRRVDFVVLFAHDERRATRFERSEIDRLGLARVAVEDVRNDPDGAARRALELLASRSERYVIHLDVDVVDFTDAPLSEHPSRNVGLKLDDMFRSLTVLASGPGLVAITPTELNAHNAAADAGLLERFAASFADTIGYRIPH